MYKTVQFTLSGREYTISQEFPFSPVVVSGELVTRSGNLYPLLREAIKDQLFDQFPARYPKGPVTPNGRGELVLPFDETLAIDIGRRLFRGTVLADERVQKLHEQANVLYLRWYLAKRIGLNLDATTILHNPKRELEAQALEIARQIWLTFEHPFKTLAAANSLNPEKPWKHQVAFSAPVHLATHEVRPSDADLRWLQDRVEDVQRCLDELWSQNYG